MADHRTGDKIALFPVSEFVGLEDQRHLIHVSDKSYRDILEYCMETHMPLGITLVKNYQSQKNYPPGSHTIAPSLFEPYNYCGAGYLTLVKKFPDGRLLTAVKIIERVKIDQVIQKIPFQIAKVSSSPCVVQDEKAAHKVVQEIRHYSEQILGDRFSRFDSRLEPDVWQTVNIKALIRGILEWMPLTGPELQLLLEQSSLESRANELLGFLKRFNEDLSGPEKDTQNDKDKNHLKLVDVDSAAS